MNFLANTGNCAGRAASVSAVPAIRRGAPAPIGGGRPPRSRNGHFSLLSGRNFYRWINYLDSFLPAFGKSDFRGTISSKGNPAFGGEPPSGKAAAITIAAQR